MGLGQLGGCRGVQRSALLRVSGPCRPGSDQAVKGSLAWGCWQEGARGWDSLEVQGCPEIHPPEGRGPMHAPGGAGRRRFEVRVLGLRRDKAAFPP